MMMSVFNKFKKIKTSNELEEPFSFLEREDNILYVNPLRNEPFQKIYLTESKLAWITIEWLSEELMDDAQKNYDELFDLHPIERGKVIMFHEDVESPRWHRSYLYTPEYDAKAHRSYMYSGKKKYDDLSLPVPFQNFLAFLNQKEKGDEYNQVIANWYVDGKDYIAPHSDCQVNMKPNAGIAIVTLCKEDSSFRELQFRPKKMKESKNDYIYKQVKIALKHGCIITMYGDTQKNFRHGIPKALEVTSSRISLTFRKYAYQS